MAVALMTEPLKDTAPPCPPGVGAAAIVCASVLHKKANDEIPPAGPWGP
ncbi:hypothetical protein [Paenibacillus chitinolyticus]